MRWWGSSGRNHFVAGALWLTAAAIISKFLGAFYRIPLAHILGSEGLGLYQMAYPLYTMVLSLATAGLPVAISVLVARRVACGDHLGASRVFMASLWLLMFLGMLGTYLLFDNAKDLAAVILKDQRAYLSLAAISPALIMAAVMAAFRGYFQGYQQMIPTAVSQVGEQMVRVITILLLSSLLISQGVEFAAAGAAFGAVTGGAVGLIILMIFFWSWRKGVPEVAAAGPLIPRFAAELERTKNIGGMPWISTVLKQLKMWRELLLLALPISLGGVVMPLMQTVDAVIIPAGLQSLGLSPSEAAARFGEFSGMASTLVYLPTIATAAIGASLVPTVSASWVAGKAAAQEKIRIAFRIVSLMAWPAAMELVALADPICLLLFSAPGAAAPLVWLAPAIILTGLYQVASAALQGIGSTFFPVLALILGAGLKALINLYMMDAWGLFAAALGSLLAFGLAALLSILYLKLHIGIRLPWVGSLLKPGLAATMMAGLAMKIYPWMAVKAGPLLGLAATMASSTLMYLLFLVALGALQERDLASIPGVGPRLAGIYRKLWL